MKKLLYILLSTLTFTFHSCQQNPVSSIPVCPVGIHINTNLDIFVHFQPTCLYDYVIADKEGLHYHDQLRRYQEGQGAHGYGGIVTMVTTSDLNPYASFDLACPACYLSTGKCHVTHIDGFYAICPDCGEQYDLSSGTGYPTKSKSKESLKRYSTSVVNGVVTVRN